MSDVEAYFDESQRDRFFCLAGYIFERQNRIALCKAWSQILRDHGMPYWHMKEATGPSGVFKGRDREEIREVSIALHDLIKAHSSGGYAVTFDLSNPEPFTVATREGY